MFSLFAYFFRPNIGVGAFAACLLVGCATQQLSPQGGHVRTDLSPPSAVGFSAGQCRTLGAVVGKGGGSFGGALISNEQLVEYAMNDLRNKSARMGGNFVQYSAPQFGMSGGNGSTNVSSAMVTGTVFVCAGSPTGPMVASAPPPTVAVSKTPDGERVLDLLLSFPTLRMHLRFDTRKPELVDWRIVGTRGTTLLGDCQSLLLLDGELTEMKSEAASPPELAFAVPLDAVQAAATATKVKGRVCDRDWYWSERQAASVKDFVAQVKDELAFRRVKKPVHKGS